MVIIENLNIVKRKKGDKMIEEYRKALAQNMELIKSLESELEHYKNKCNTQRDINNGLKEKVELWKSNCKEWENKYQFIYKQLDELQTTVSLNDVLNGGNEAKKLQVKNIDIKLAIECYEKCKNFAEFQSTIKESI